MKGFKSQGNFLIYLALRALVTINPVIKFFQILMQPVNFLLPEFFIRFRIGAHFQSCNFRIVPGNFSVTPGKAESQIGFFEAVFFVDQEFIKFRNLSQLFFGTFGKVWGKVSQIPETGLDAITFGAQFL